MKKSQLVMIALGAGILLGASLASAQRAPSAAYDSSKKINLKGPVTRIDWVTPGAFLSINIQDANGTVSNWAVELGNPLDLEKDGWKPSVAEAARVHRERDSARGVEQQLAVELDAALARSAPAGDELEQRRLARARGAEEAQVARARLDVHVELEPGQRRAEAQGEAPCAHERGSARRSRRSTTNTLAKANSTHRPTSCSAPRVEGR